MSLIDQITLYLPNLPVHLDGMTIVHLSDFHITQTRGRHQRIIDQIEKIHPDLFFLTGDYITTYGDEPVAMSVMEKVCRVLNPKHGVFGVFGNHDSFKFKRLASELPVQWLNNRAFKLTEIEVEVLGFDTDEASVPDAVAAIASRSSETSCGSKSHSFDSSAAGIKAVTDTRPSSTAVAVDIAECDHAPDGCGDQKPLRLLLCHYPTYLPTASDMGVDLMFSGHTHGGQCRLPWGRALANSTDLPSKLTSGIFRHRDTCCLVSRGLGENILPFRVFCPPHIPMYTLRRGAMIGKPSAHMVNAVPW